MDTIRPEIKIVRIDSNFSSSPNHILAFDVLRKGITITNIDTPVNIQDRSITITVSLTYKINQNEPDNTQKS